MPIVIHTSDLHLGATLGWLGPRAGEQREQLRRTLSKIVNIVIDQQADALVVAGDLFHSNNPSAATVRFVMREFTRLTNDCRAHVVLLPGTHDSLGTDSVYSSYREEFGKIERVSVLGLDGLSCVGIDSAGLALHGSPPRHRGSVLGQLEALEPDPDFPYNVGILHGPLEGPEEPPIDDLDAHGASPPIRVSELQSEGWSYYALGYHHTWSDVAGAAAPAVYPGAPEIVGIDDEGPGQVARVELRASGATVSKVRVGTRSVITARVDVTGAADSFSVAERVRQQAMSNPQAVLRLSLTGIMSADSGIDDGDLVEELAPDYFHVCPPVRDYHVKLSDHDLAQLPERLVVGRFARHMRSRLAEAASEQERQEIEDALQLGVALLQGKDVVG
ncbi:MAG: exonuclease SbcCD subunit D [Candidatus Eisenbacteria bacterium]|nr:exonuclease SbcCD subunit D [Candidatus Eisenbacteria bacterium]